VAPSLWAISFSWCGNCRSAPPPWMSKVSPSSSQVRELQVGAAAVDVEGLAQQLAGHGRAFDVPAGAAGAEVAGPLHVLGLALLGALPQHRVQRVVLAVEHGHALAGMQLVQRLARELAVAGELAHRVVHVAVGRAVGQALVFQGGDHREHLRHVLGGARLVRGALDAQRVGILVQRVDHAVGEAADAFLVLHRTLDDLVVHVGDVAHVVHAIAARLEPALHHVEGDHRAGVAEVAVVVDGHAAHVHADLARLQGRKDLQLTRERVVDAQTHGIGEGVDSLAPRQDVCPGRRTLYFRKGGAWQEGSPGTPRLQ